MDESLFKNSILIELQPDDVIVLDIHDPIKPEQIDGMQKYLKECFGDRKIIIVGPNANFNILRANEAKMLEENMKGND